MNQKNDLRWAPCEDSTEWDTFIRETGGTPYQSWAWRSVLVELGNIPEYLACRGRNGKIVAGCPLFIARAGKYRRKLTGPVHTERLDSDHSVRGVLPIPSIFGPDADVHLAIRSLQHYLEGLRFPAVTSLDLMTSQAFVIQSLKERGFRNWETHGDLLSDLVSTPTMKIWTGIFGKHDRQSVKYFASQETSFRLSTDQGDFGEFLKLHESTMARERYRPMSAEYLSFMRRHLGDRLQVALSVGTKGPIAGQLLILDDASKTVYIDKIGYTRSRNIHSSVVHIWFEVCAWAEENGFRYVNFGGARSAEALKLKQRFGGEFRQYHMFVVPSGSKLYPVASGFMKGIRKLVRGASSVTYQRNSSSSRGMGSTVGVL